MNLNGRGEKKKKSEVEKKSRFAEGNQWLDLDFFGTELKIKEPFRLVFSENLRLKKVKKKIIIMKRQRNTTQMKEQTRSTEVQINEEEIGKLPEKEFRIMIVKMIKNLENKMEKMQESINKDLEE